MQWIPGDHIYWGSVSKSAQTIKALNIFWSNGYPCHRKNKWLAKILGYGYEIIYKKGHENVIANALSRQFEEENTLLAISLPIPDWIK